MWHSMLAPGGQKNGLLALHLLCSVSFTFIKPWRNNLLMLLFPSSTTWDYIHKHTSQQFGRNRNGEEQLQGQLKQISNSWERHRPAVPCQGLVRVGLSLTVPEGGRWGHLGFGDQVQPGLQRVRHVFGDGADPRSSQEVSLPVRSRSSDCQAGPSWQSSPEVQAGKQVCGPAHLRLRWRPVLLQHGSGQDWRLSLSLNRGPGLLGLRVETAGEAAQSLGPLGELRALMR